MLRGWSGLCFDSKNLVAFAAVAILLAIVGICGMITYSPVQRTQEVGIRRALGAQQSDILGLVISQGLGLTVARVVLGLGRALALSQLMETFLFQVSTTDPRTLAEIALMLIVVAAGACYIPARKPSRIQTMSVLRSYGSE